MKPKRIYIETSIISYLAARRSRDLVISAWQEITREFWDKHRGRYRLHTSELVVEECRMGDAEAVRNRLALLRGIPEIPVDAAARQLASALLAQKALPRKAAIDALHIAVAAAGSMDYLLTWNCRHLNNPVIKPLVRSICIGFGCSCPEICTPFELTEGDKP